MTEPTDNELDAVIAEYRTRIYPQDMQPRFERAIMRAAIAKWGTPPAVAPWRSAVLDLIDDCPGLTLEQDRWLSRRVKELDFASTPQPTQAQSGAVPLTPERIREIERNHVYSQTATLTDLVRTVERAHGIGIKGGQHGADN